MLNLTVQDRGFLSALKISPEAPLTREHLEHQVGWLYAVNQELGAEAARLREDAERFDVREARMRHQRLCLFCLLIVSWAFNIRSLMEWAASFRLP